MTKFPDYDELTTEQRDFCRQRPGGETVVSGPPGTGKTVVAFHRAKQILQQTSDDVLIVMYNNVLSKYVAAWEQSIRRAAGLEDDDKRLSIKTWDTWMTGWLAHRQAQGQRVKPWGWSLYFYREIIKWNFDYPWDEICEKLAEKNTSGKKIREWPHLIIDEGQDFPVGFYKVVQRMVRYGKSKSVTVSVDENQTITDRNSTIEETCRKLQCSIEPDGESHHSLTKNFRNTLQIARVASTFFSGAPTEIPQLPDERVNGDVPEIRIVDAKPAARDRLDGLIESRPTQKLGIFVRRQSAVDDLIKHLSSRFGNGKRVVQFFYAQGSVADTKALAERLEFQRPGTVTVLCDKSVKGLEFDTVVIHDVEDWSPSAEHFKKSYYVMCSRATETLELHCVSDPRGDEPAVIRELPSGSNGIDAAADQEGVLEWIR